MTQETLDSVLTGEQGETEPPVDAKEPEIEAKSEPTEPPAETKSEPPSPPAEPKEEEWTKTAVLDERRKRQALERQIEELKQSSQKPAERPDLIEDPDGAYNHIEGAISKALRDQAIAMSTAMMKREHGDYDEMESIFLDLAKENSSLIQEMSQHSLPALFAYETAKKHVEFEKMKDVDSYREKIREEERQKLLAEMEKESGARKAKSDSITPSLVDRGSASTNQAVVEEGLSEILGR